MLASLRALIVIQAVVLAHVVISVLVQAAGWSGEGWWNASEVIGILESLAYVGSLAWLFRERREERLQAALVLAALQLVLDLSLAWRVHFSTGGGSVWLDSVLPAIVAHAAALLLWLALARLADELRVVLGGLHAAFFVVLGMRFLLWMGRALFSLRLYVELGSEQARAYMMMMSYASTALSLSIEGLLLLLLLRVARQVEAGGGVVAAVDAPAIVTAGGGGRFVVAYGAIIVGIARIVRGLTRRS